MGQKYGVCVTTGGYKKDGLHLPPFTVVPVTEMQSRLLRTPGRMGSIKDCFLVEFSEKVKISEPLTAVKEEKSEVKPKINITENGSDI